MIKDEEQPEGLQESSRWSESAETTGKVVSHDRTPKGCKESSRWSESAKTTGKVVSHDRTPKGSVGKSRRDVMFIESSSPIDFGKPIYGRKTNLLRS